MSDTTIRSPGETPLTISISADTARPYSTGTRRNRTPSASTTKTLDLVLSFASNGRSTSGVWLASEPRRTSLSVTVAAETVGSLGSESQIAPCKNTMQTNTAAKVLMRPSDSAQKQCRHKSSACAESSAPDTDALLRIGTQVRAPAHPSPGPPRPELLGTRRCLTQLERHLAAGAFRSSCSTRSSSSIRPRAGALVRIVHEHTER
jgi:hypothetical protein